ncbi:MAG: hypothetical protein JKY51_01970 [Opitutaceae bacterium]|nr:hypothetical protein [Opitutaceae bacterium]
MKIEIFALCDAATDYGGKLNILGAFDGIFAPKVPVVQAHCAIALRLRLSKVEEGKHHIKLNLIDQDGRLVVPGMDANVDVKVPSHRDSVAINLVLNLQQLKFEQFDEYSLDLAIDNRHEASLPISVVKLENNRPALP